MYEVQESGEPLDPEANLQEIQGTEEHVNTHHGETVSEIQTVVGSTE